MSEGRFTREIEFPREITSKEIGKLITDLGDYLNLFPEFEMTKEGWPKGFVCEPRGASGTAYAHLSFSRQGTGKEDKYCSMTLYAETPTDSRRKLTKDFTDRIKSAIDDFFKK